jgi:hypothetical protein
LHDVRMGGSGDRVAAAPGVAGLQFVDDMHALGVGNTSARLEYCVQDILRIFFQVRWAGQTFFHSWVELAAQ